MKKMKLLALLTAALIFSACQKEDTVPENAVAEITSAEKSVSDTVETSEASAGKSEVVSSEKVTEYTVSESGIELKDDTEETADETLLQKAMRNAGELGKYGVVGRIFIDLNFDGFPEMIECDKYDNYYLYTFNMGRANGSCTGKSATSCIYITMKKAESIFISLLNIRSTTARLWLIG